MYQSFVTHRGGVWFWVALLLSILSVVAYAWHDVPQPPGGGTWLGYTLGTVGALLILWLLYLGRRKRDYHSRLGTVQGWTSAHVYLGTSLIVVATLHAGFQFGLNVHTLAYVLTMLVIVSGFFGVWAYLHYPQLLSENSGGKTRSELFREVAELDRQLLRHAAELGSELETAVVSAVERTQVGGGLLAQLGARDDSTVMLPGRGLQGNRDQRRILDLVVEQISETSHRQRGALLREVSNLFGARSRLLRRIRRDIQIQGLLRIWLYVHVPLAFACLAALIVHVIVVFVYW